MKPIMRAPVFVDDDKTRAARILWIVLAVFMAVSLLLGGSSLFTHDRPLPLLISASAMIVLCHLGLSLVGRGYVKTTAIGLTCVLWLFFTAVVLLNGADGYFSLVNYFTLVIVAGLTLGRSVGFISAIVSIASAVAANRLSTSGIIPVDLLASTPASVLVSYGGNLVLVSVLLGVATTDAKKAILRARLSEGNLIAANEKLFRAEKLRAIGEMAAGVAHDFANLLTAVNGHVAMIEAEAEAEEHAALSKETKGIRDATERAKALVDKLLLLGRQHSLKPETLSINELIANIKILIERSLGTEITFTIDLCEENPRIFADPVHLEQVIVNIALNAKDAMPDGGVFSITTRLLTISSIDPDVAGAPQDYVEVSLSDTGFGMSEQTAQRAFEPFYTTKDIGRGSGLGLSTAYSVVSQSDGQLNVESTEEVGTTIQILLPCAVKLGQKAITPAISQ